MRRLKLTKNGLLCFVKNGFFAVSLLFSPSVYAHKGYEHRPASGDSLLSERRDSMIDRTNAAAADTITATEPLQSEGSGVMGIEEKPGAMIPLSLKFANQNGDSVTFAECLKGPTLFSMLYYQCKDACGLLLSGVTRVLRTYEGRPEGAPNVVFLSIGEQERPSDAAQAKTIADDILQKKYPNDKMHFLTGSAKNIAIVTAATGFHFVKKGNDYDHPLLLIVLSPQGKVTRYIMGADFLPADIALSLMEAKDGTIQPAIARALRSCFSYDPKGRRLVFKTLQVSATVILSLLGIFVVFLVVVGKSRRKKGNP
jgi:protein SCO1